MIHFNRKSLALLSMAGLLSTSSAFAAGFEKSQSWSAAAAAQASAVVGSTKGAEALYFNPAGLEQSNGKEVSLNFSPTFSAFSGANPYQNRGTVDGKSGFSPVAALVASYKVTDKLGLGIGYYVSGGTKSKYENLDYTAAPIAGVPAAFTPTVNTDLAITEAALGAGYEVMPGFRVGAALRAVMVKADFATVARTGASSYRAATVTDIKATRWNAYKLGAQYESSDKIWGVGANYRSAVKFIGKGNGTQVNSGTPTTTTDIGQVEIENEFPQQFVLGGFRKVNESLRVSAEYSYTDYSNNVNLYIRGGLNTVIYQNWKNQHVGRLGFEYTGMSMPIRFGYAYTSQVTPSDFARSTFASPGPGHSIVAGTGMMFGDIDFDVAGEYSFASGNASNISTINAALASEVASAADFKSHAYAAHLSAKYHF